MNHIRVGDLTHGAFWKEPNRVLFYGSGINPDQLALYARVTNKIPSFFASSDLQENIYTTLCGDTPFLTVVAGVLQKHQVDIAHIFNRCSIELPPIFELLIIDPVERQYDIEVVKMGLGEPLTGVVYAQDPRGLFVRNGKGTIKRVFNSGQLKVAKIQPYVSKLVKEWVADKGAYNKIIPGLMGILSDNLTDGTWIHEVFLEQLRQDGIIIPEDHITFTLSQEPAQIYLEQNNDGRKRSK